MATAMDRIQKSRARTQALVSRARLASMAPGTKGLGDDIYNEATGGGSQHGQDRNYRNVARQLMASTKDHVYTAIRPIASVVASQPVRAGFRASTRITSIREGRITTKMWGEGPEGLILQANDYRHKSILTKAPSFIKAHADGVDLVDSHPMIDLFADPNEFMTQGAFLTSIVWSIVATGEAIVYFDVEGGRLKMYYLPRTWVTPIHENGPFSAYKLTIPGSSNDKEMPPIPRDRIAHFMVPHPLNPMAPLSVVQAQAHAINTDDEMQVAQYASMKNVTKPGMVVIAGDYEDYEAGGQVKGRIKFTKPQRSQIRRAIKQRLQGAMNFGDPIILDRLIKDVKPYMATPKDLDYPRGSELTKERIFSGIGTPEIVTGLTQSANRATAYVAQDIFFTNVVNPIITLISQVMTKKSNQIFETPPGVELVVFLERAEPRDADLRLKQLMLLAQNEAITGNQLREALGFEQMPGLDELVSAATKQSLQSQVEASANASASGSDPAPEDIQKAFQFFLDRVFEQQQAM